MKIDAEQVNESTSEYIQANITDSIKVIIQSVNSNVPLNQSVYAINWFNTRLLWLYDFYNFLGAFSVKKIGGKPVFKGCVRKVLHGSGEHRRDVLLIVHYPGVNNFKKMLESTYFKIVSLLRMIAVKQFTFGFSCRTDMQNDSVSQATNKAYAIHHYIADKDIVKKLAEVTQHYGVNIYFSSRISSLLFSVDTKQNREQVPCLMDGVVLLQADTKAQLEQAIAEDEYQLVIKQTISSFLATLDRVF